MSQAVLCFKQSIPLDLMSLVDETVALFMVLLIQKNDLMFFYFSCFLDTGSPARTGYACQ